VVPVRGRERLDGYHAILLRAVKTPSQPAYLRQTDSLPKSAGCTSAVCQCWVSVVDCNCLGGDS